MGKTLRNIIASGVIASALTLGACTPAYHPRLIEKRVNVPTYNNTPEGWQTFYNEIDERKTTKGELTYIREYRGLRKEVKEEYADWIHLEPMLPESPEVEARRRKGELTNKDLIFIYNLSEKFGEFVDDKIHFFGH